MAIRVMTTVILLFSIFSVLEAGEEWYQLYEDGQEAMKLQDWTNAVKFLSQAIESNPNDQDKVRTYGLHFIEYYPHRELGISLYNMGQIASAKKELDISMTMEPSDRAESYLSKIDSNVLPEKTETKVETQPVITPIPPPAKEQEMIVGQQTIKLVGERMGVAILPFENKGASHDLGEIILDKLITIMVNQERFKVMERAQLDKILAEQSLGASGVVDATTAAEIGKGIGVDAIVIGSVAATTSGTLSIDARVIDTESAAIIVAEDVYTGSSDAQSVKNAAENLANKISQDLPLVEGYIIRIDGAEVLLDVGRIGGLRRGMKCIIYKEGAEIKHPITGEILGKETKILGELSVSDSFDKYCVAKLLTSNGTQISIGDKFLTK